MAKYTPYALSALPTTGIDVNGIYFIKVAGKNKFTVHIRKNDNSAWIDLGLTNGVNAVNGLTGDVKIDLNLTGGTLKITATGTGTAATITEIDLDQRYRKISDHIAWALIDNVPGFAMDNAVVHKASAETVTGVKTFSASPVVPIAVASTQAVNKEQMDSADSALQDQINTLQTTVSSGLSYKGDIDASTNPNYPSADAGDVYIISTAGKIGDASGIEVNVGNMLICKENGTAAGDQATVGDKWTIIQSDLDQATETVAGFAKIATQAQTDTGTDDKTIVTPKKLQKKINDNDSANDGKYVRFDAAQTLTSGNKTTARNNIGAADDAAVVKLTGNQTVAGVKTFSSVPVLPASAPTSDNQATRKKYVDDTTATAVAWGGSNGKEW